MLVNLVAEYTQAPKAEATMMYPLILPKCLPTEKFDTEDKTGYMQDL